MGTKELPVTKEILLDWLGEVPDGAQIKIDVGQYGQRSLVAVSRNDDQWILAMTDFPDLPDDDEEVDNKVDSEANGHNPDSKPKI